MIQVPTNLQQAKDDLSRASLERRIPHKAHFTLGEVCDLCQVRPDILRAWENQFSQLRSERRRANRRFFSRDEVFFIYQIAALVQQQGMSIPAARAWLDTNPLIEKNITPPEALTSPLTAPVEKKSVPTFMSFSDKAVIPTPPLQTFSPPLPTITPPSLVPPTPVIKSPSPNTSKSAQLHQALTEILSILNGKK